MLTRGLVGGDDVESLGGDDVTAAVAVGGELVGDGCGEGDEGRHGGLGERSGLGELELALIGRAEVRARTPPEKANAPPPGLLPVEDAPDRLAMPLPRFIARAASSTCGGARGSSSAQEVSAKGLPSIGLRPSVMET